MSKYIFLVPLFPLIGFLINGLFRKRISKSLAGLIGSGTILASFVVSLLIFFEVKEENFQPAIVSFSNSSMRANSVYRFLSWWIPCPAYSC